MCSIACRLHSPFICDFKIFAWIGSHIQPIRVQYMLPPSNLEHDCLLPDLLTASEKEVHKGEEFVSAGFQVSRSANVVLT